jgi:2,4-dichlorophenol 6-monooxygenase
VRKLIGKNDIPVTIDAMSTWTINQQYAARNTLGRVFCMGDAVHRHTPMNGLGLNTSVQDSYNLCWKLAMVLKGQATPKLLESYDAERTPVAKQIVDRAFRSIATLPPIFGALDLPPAPTEAELENCLAMLRNPSPEAAGRRKALRAALNETLIGFGAGHGVELNQRYASQAVHPDGTSDAGFTSDRERFYQASTRPGAHLPHVWLTVNQRRISTLDLCGKGTFTLLTGVAGQSWREAAAQVSQAMGVEIRVHVIGPGQQYVDTYGDYARMSEIDESGALLVRPDMFIGWRAADASMSSQVQLSAALHAILGRD